MTNTLFLSEQAEDRGWLLKGQKSHSEGVVHPSEGVVTTAGMDLTAVHLH